MGCWLQLLRCENISMFDQLSTLSAQHWMELDSPAGQSVVIRPSDRKHLLLPPASMLNSRRRFVSMRDFLEDLEVRSSVSASASTAQSERPSREEKQRSKKHRLRNFFRLEENREKDSRDSRYASLVEKLIEKWFIKMTKNVAANSACWPGVWREVS